MNKVIQTTHELVEHFIDQIDLLKIHCQTYDSGKILVYKELAVKLRLLLRETKNQKSLFRQLGIDQMHFINSAIPFNPNNLLPTANLLIMDAPGVSFSSIFFQKSGKPNRNEHFSITNFNSSEFTFIPSYDRHLTNEKFENWWSEQVVLTDVNKNRFSREMIVLSVADQFGGAHVDPSIGQPLYNIINNNSIGINNQRDLWIEGDSAVNSATFTTIGAETINNENAVNTPIPPSIRQIAEEVIRTVESNVQIINDEGSFKIRLIRTETKRDIQYDYDANFRYSWPNTFQNFEKVVNHYFPERKTDDLKSIYVELKTKGIGIHRLIKCYLRNIEKLKKEEIETFGHSGDGWSLKGIIYKIISKL